VIFRGSDVRAAIRAMARLPRPRERRTHWTVLGVAAVLAVIFQLVSGLDWATFGLGAGTVFGAAVAFIGAGRLWGWIAISAGLGLALGTLPLFGVLGLELSLVVALIASVMSADLGCAIARRIAATPPSGISRATYPMRTLFGNALATAGVTVAITLIPGVIAACRGIVVPTCDWWFGITSYIAMPLASAALGGAIGHAIGATTGPRRFGPAWLAQLPALLVALAALWRFHGSPPVYTYNALLGYFPGNMYDEHITLQLPLLWSRLEQLAWVIAVLALVAWRFDVASYRIRRDPRPAGRRGGALVLAVLAIAGAVGLRWNGGSLGFAVDATDLEEALGGRLETEHWIIYYTPSKDIEDDLALIAQDHEFRYAQVVAQLGVEPDHKLISFYFADRDQKGRLHGSRDVEMAKPWRGEIYLEHRAFPHNSLRHEIGHAIAAEFGDPLWGIASRRFAGIPLMASPGLVEGLAVAVDWPAGYERLNPHESVRVIQKLDKLPSLDTLFSLNFFSISSAQGYTTAGSFLRFLLDKYGAPKLRDIYRNGGDFEAAYGVPRDRLEGEWRAMLATIDVPDSVVEAQKERFRGTSVFARPCPHAVAKRFRHAVQLLGEGKRADAIEQMRSVCADSLLEPRYVLQLGDMLFADDGDRNEAVTQWSMLAIDNRGVTISVRAQAYRRLARAAALRGEWDRTKRLIDLARSLPLDLDERRELDAMAFTLSHGGPAAKHLRIYFFQGDKAPSTMQSATAAVAAEPSLGLAHYLLALQKLNAEDYAGAARSFEAALALELPGLAFVKNAARRLAIAAYRTHDLARLGLATSVLSGSQMSSGDRLLAKDWLDRVRFDETRRR
jgi:hypothetical protein